MRTAPRAAQGEIPGRLLDAGRRLAFRCLCAMVAAALLSPMVPAVHAEDTPSMAQVGQASWYGHEFARRRTASGDRFDPLDLTGAHRTLPLGCKVRVTNLHNGRSVLVTINDRGPYRHRRAIDLSYGAASALGMVRRGIARVRIELVES